MCKLINPFEEGGRGKGEGGRGKGKGEGGRGKGEGGRGKGGGGRKINVKLWTGGHLLDS